MTSEPARAMALSRALLFQTPILSGWVGLTARAQVITFFSNGNDAEPRPPLVGSLYKSHNRMRGSFVKRLITAGTYASIRGCVVESITKLCPGLGDQAQAYQPLSGSGCLPTFGSCSRPKTQSSNSVGINLILCRAHIAINVSSVFKK